MQKALRQPWVVCRGHVLLAACLLAWVPTGWGAARTGGVFTMIVDAVSSGGPPLQGGRFSVNPSHTGWLPLGNPRGNTFAVESGFVPLVAPASDDAADPPQPVIVVSADPGECGQVLTFDGSQSTAAPGRRIVSYAWDFGDGIVAADPIAQQAFSTVGVRRVELTVLDDGSPALSATASLDFAIVDTTAPTIVCPPEAVVACGASIDPSQTGFATAVDSCESAILIAYSDQGESSDPCPNIIRRAWTATDAAGNRASCEQLIVVYDPNGSFVTGAGSFWSPRGAYRPGEQLEGVARFAFVSKYAPGANVPTGPARLWLQFADVLFQADSYEWLVVGGAKAQFKGVGKINGFGDYGFMVSAIDSALTRNQPADTLRFKIWSRIGGELVYDNQLGTADDAGPTTAITSGQIVIHAARQKPRPSGPVFGLSQQAPLLSAQRMDAAPGAGAIQLSLRGDSLRLYAIQVSADLRQWQHLDYVLADSGGHGAYSAAPPFLPAAFYRAVLAETLHENRNSPSGAGPQANRIRIKTHAAD